MSIICITRLVYRKGIDLLIAALPKVCALHSDVQFLIGELPLFSHVISVLRLNAELTNLLLFASGGDGPKIVELDQMRDKYQTLLRDRVQLLGPVKHEDVRSVSPSLTLVQRVH